MILAGASVIIYNKAIHAAKHITTWHALFGIIVRPFRLSAEVLLEPLPSPQLTFCPPTFADPLLDPSPDPLWCFRRLLALDQHLRRRDASEIGVEVPSVRPNPLFSLSLSFPLTSLLDSITGYLTLSFLFITPLLALDSDWVQNNSSFAERVIIGSGLGVTAVGVLMRIR